MTTAEKLTRIAERMPEVYKAGQKSMIDESKVIEKTVSGSVIVINDASEVPHDVEVQLSGNNYNSVKVFGESLIKSPLQEGIRTVNGITFTDNGNGTVTANGTATADATYVFKSIKMLGSYTLNGIIGGSTSTYFMGLGSSDYADTGNGVTRIYETETAQNVFLRIKSGVTVNNVVFVPILEKGESSKTVYNASENGYVAIKRIAPYMNIISDTKGINITATYLKSWGMQTEYDRFWDAYQNNGNVVIGHGMFSGNQWNDATYQPKYPIKVSFGTQLFHNALITNTVVPVDISGAAGEKYFNYCINLVIIPKLIVNENTTFSSAFSYCSKLEEICFEGVIGKSLDIHWSTKLSAESYENIFKCMTVTVSGQTLTVPNSTAEATYNAKYGSGKWASRVKGIKALGWAISYL